MLRNVIQFEMHNNIMISTRYLSGNIEALKYVA